MKRDRRFHGAGAVVAAATLFFLFCPCAPLFAEQKVLDASPLKITVDDYSGSFAFYLLNPRTKKYEALLETAEHSSSSGFYLKNGISVRKLARGAGVAVAAVVEDSIATLTYTVKDGEVVTVSFMPFASNEKTGIDCIRVDVAIQNVAPYAQTCSLKAVFDTVLGERTATHFSTAQEERVNTERLFDTMDRTRYICSRNDTSAIQFLLSGADISVPESVCIANRDVLLTESWLPSVRTGRTFDSIESYNNSAVGVYWRPMQLSEKTKSSLTFYISVANNGRVPGTVRTLGLDTGNSVKSTVTAGDDQPTYTDSYGMTYVLGAITQEQLDPDYINNLFDRIKELEQNVDSTTRDEIQKLNAELDAIFIKLGRTED